MDEGFALLQRARGGDNEAFDALVQPHLPRTYRVAYLITRNEADAADALQEGLFRAYRSLGNVAEGRPFYPWFMRIVVNEALKQGKRRSGTLLRELPAAPAFESPEGNLLAREEREELWRAVQELSPDQRAVVVLRYYEELSEREMAETLGVRAGTVKSRLHHARLALEKCLGAVNWGLRRHLSTQGRAHHE